MTNLRPLSAQEIAGARPVFQDTTPYDRVQISDFGSGGAVTLAGRSLTDPKFQYVIHWGERVFRLGVRGTDLVPTLIHELVHVWQGENGAYPTFYMGQSAWAQLKNGIEDFIEKRDWQA